jgi:hypothetical protein
VTRFHNVPLTCALLGALGLVSASASADTRPVVVELFTSQSCSSCPPADALLGELARRGDVVALGFHISYWDGLGWKDPFSSRSSTDRQRVYAQLFGLGQVYTPQMVVDGAREMVGSDRDQVLAAVRDARPETIAPVNARRTLQDANGVEMLTALGSWNGSALSFAIEPPADGEGLAVLVQAPDGRMLGAAVLLGSG